MFTRQFSRVLTPRPQLSRFFTGISRRRYVLLRRLCLSLGNVYPHRESTSWNFLAKIKNSLRPIPSFDMMSKFPGWDHSCKRTWTSCSAERRNNEKETYASVCEAVRNKHGSKVTGPSRDRPLLEVMRPSADCQTAFFRRLKQFGNILEKVAERSCDSGWRSRDRRPSVKQRFFDGSSN